MDRRTFLGAVAVVPLVAALLETDGRPPVLAGPKEQPRFLEPVECFGKLPFDHPVVAFDRRRDQAHTALEMGRHPETWMPLDPDELVRTRAEYEGVLILAEQGPTGARLRMGDA